MEVDKQEETMYEFQDKPWVPDACHEYTSALQGGQVPIIIDNGSWMCRAGWATEDRPRLLFRSLMARQRRDKAKKESEVQVGNDIVGIDTIPTYNIKSPFERNVVTQMDIQELILDHIFTRLGVQENLADHPLVLTEAPCVPNYARGMMSELLFESYGIPQVCYGIDGLFSSAQNLRNGLDTLVVDLGHQTIHVLPVVDGKYLPAASKRINIGGASLSYFLLRILQLRYPGHASSLSLLRVEELLHNLCEVAAEYKPELMKWFDQAYFAKNVIKVQLPYNAALYKEMNDARQRALEEKRQHQVRHLLEMHRRRREAKVTELEEKLVKIGETREALKEPLDEEAFQHILEEAGFHSPEQLEEVEQNLIEQLCKIRQKLNIETPAPNTAKLPCKSNTELEKQVVEMRQRRQELLDKRQQIQQKKAETAKRGTRAARERMQLLWRLAEDPVSGEDLFGAKDEDWDVYRQVSRDNWDSEEEEVESELVDLEKMLAQYDRAAADNACINPQELYQLNFGIERYRVPELLFEPGMLGLDHVGLIGAIESVLQCYDSDIQARLRNNVFVTGGLAKLPGFTHRLKSEIIAISPYQSEIQVSVAKDPILDAWYGATLVCQDPNVYLTRQIYLDYGFEYLVEHAASNKFFPSPVLSYPLLESDSSQQ